MRSSSEFGSERLGNIEKADIPAWCPPFHSLFGLTTDRTSYFLWKQIIQVIRTRLGIALYGSCHNGIPWIRFPDQTWATPESYDLFFHMEVLIVSLSRFGHSSAAPAHRKFIARVSCLGEIFNIWCRLALIGNVLPSGLDPDRWEVAEASVTGRERNRTCY
ncbi:hypothetical protein CROQUDRAFT_108925 [Cronartium quercuum f. sp. fusiforme G11]|uniref:Uncharacterized protein n=1 Tax=Cronartium quercuum f. sp. fusiforme G11 TaxID=708437 RepID=A0A9P6T9R3_9BASI|nr:hypothetical protein CROQUDRAFT_108925 [Cronartium quercuum f. sp. fusiforme G11]